MKKKISYLFLSISIIAFASCAKKQSKQDETPQPAGKTANLRLSDEVTLETGNYRNNERFDNSFFIRYFPYAETKRPLIIAIHGGGFIHGDKADYSLPARAWIYSTGQYVNVLTEAELDHNKFAYASINYTLLVDGGAATSKECLADGKAFFDYIRLHADQYNIDPDKIILFGDSGGAEMSLWIGLQSELNAGAVKGIVAINPQASMNLFKWNNEVFAPYNATDVFTNFYAQQGEDKINKRLQMMYGSTNKAYVNSYAATNKLHLLDLIDSSDPELHLSCVAPRHDAVHSPYHVWTLKQKAQTRGLAAKVNFIDGTSGYYPTYVNPNYESVINFCIRKFQ